MLFVLDMSTKISAGAHSIDANNCKIDVSTAHFIPNLLCSWSTFETSLQKWSFDIFHRYINIQYGQLSVDRFVPRSYRLEYFFDLHKIFLLQCECVLIPGMCFHFIIVAEHFKVVHVPYHSKDFGWFSLFKKNYFWRVPYTHLDYIYLIKNTVKL